MYKFSKILVGLDQSSMDYDLVKAACKVCRLSGTKEVYFMNLIRDFHVPDDVLKEFPDLLEKALEQRKIEIEDMIRDHFTCPGVKVKFVVKQGQPTREIMSFADKEEIDLIVLGRKNEKKGGGVLINRLARRAGRSILILPKDTKLKIDRILIPIDYSSYSKLALEKAVELSRASSGNNTIITQNVYAVPSGYHYTGKSFEEFGHIMKKNAEKDFHKFIQEIDMEGVNSENDYTLDEDEDVIAQIYQHSKQKDADIIIIGAKGRSTTASLFIGSKAEKLIQMDADIPLIVVRPKGQIAGFRESIKEI